MLVGWRRTCQMCLIAVYALWDAVRSSTVRGNGMGERGEGDIGGVYICDY